MRDGQKETLVVVAVSQEMIPGDNPNADPGAGSDSDSGG